MASERTRSPCKSKLGAEVVLGGRVEIAAGPDGHSGQDIRPTSKNHGRQLVMEKSERTEVLPPHAQVDGQVRLQLPVVLREESQQVLAGVFPDVCRNAVCGIKRATFDARRIVEEVPIVVKSPVWPRGPGGVLHEMQLGDFPA